MVQGVGGSGGEGVEGLGFGFGSVWLRDLGMQLCFGFTSDVFAKLHIYLIIGQYCSELEGLYNKSFRSGVCMFYLVFGYPPSPS